MNEVDIRPLAERSEAALREPSGLSAAQNVYEALRRRIINLDLEPDRVLNRRELAAEYGVSLMPIREALQLLEQDGLVRIRPQSGTVVTRIDLAQLRENQFLRIAVESEVVRQLAATRPEATLARARAIIDMQSVLAGDLAQMDLFTELDRNFHRTLFEGVGMERLHAMLARRLGHLTRCQRLELPRAGKMHEIIAAHSAILEGIEAGQAEAAAEAMRRHLTGTIQRLDLLCREHPDFFTPASV
ncbi:DNA-binding transcriptional regulator, GntR family [Meinhardsimonia xiamenensis]|uniref:DNA-binding transcriptional regulator, GntR family n=1 Tax=Meinhardsimonia xiamenensis TaxID=990712 RepID=A0A1G9ADR4_9RHOB|nr:GntR family transcriptional regulator [Meinhardsimonia xiamenensis]PRX35429.1 DNA-binding GntR family transcriptional regulator [Meinhardsimonia xiamenensis]SDK25411.1 DNA-binding transcriptional regulator, GntR family [Meinhardsimonia xiamenensis]